MDDNKPIRPFEFWVQRILPLAYDDSLSYLEVLLKVKIKLNEVISWANNYQSQLYEYVDQKVLENLKEMESQLQQFQGEINNQLAGYDTRISILESNINGVLQNVTSLINQFRTEIERKMAQFQIEIQSDIREFQNKIDSQIAQNENWVKAQIAQQQIYINAQLEVIRGAIAQNLIDANRYTDEQIQKVLDQIPEIDSVNVIYPGNHQLVSIQEAVNMLWYDLTFFTLTAEEYAALSLSAHQYEGYNLTSRMYDLYGKRYLMGGDGNGNGEDTVAREMALEAKTLAQQALVNVDGLTFTDIRISVSSLILSPTSQGHTVLSEYMTVNTNDRFAEISLVDMVILVDDPNPIILIPEPTFTTIFTSSLVAFKGYSQIHMYTLNESNTLENEYGNPPNMGEIINMKIFYRLKKSKEA